ncbi:hypothetical protein [Rhodohalobacter mucosus]|uniref:Uncharacterized protein n=1 Tax=Rhodohalobacter mucosus TaxID=2079485 RepID=A0A316TNL6_9BACT|nr:hypothetical protein [Rhodohalobacter mucosus]PWN05241.1 hypothetical protein DDZ15_14255 [Rhodohalobacter mucosus]
MLLRFIQISILTTVLFIAGCSGNGNQVLIEDSDLSMDNASISLLTIELDYLYDDFPDHSFGALRPKEKSVFERNLLNLLSASTATPVTGRLNGLTLLDHPFEVRNYNIEEGNLSILSPAEGTSLSDSQTQSRFTIILDQFYFTPFQVQLGGGSYAGHEGTMERRLRFDTNYLIWDNEKGDAIAWGKINSTATLSLQNQNRTYNNLILDAFNQIIRVSPFRPVFNV